MKLTKILIENLGPYIGKNELEFSVENNSKRVILIGGKNGAGKTTLFKAIRIGLYGCRAFGYEMNNSRYIGEISKIINHAKKLSKNGVAKINIELLMDDGRYDNVYMFERIWKLSTKQLREEYNLYKNGVLMSISERSDFESYLFQLIPPDMFKFYFFDGEQLSDFVFSGIKNTDFKNAFLKLCGLDTIEIIIENFRRISRSRFKDDENISKKYFEVAEKQKNLKVQLDKTILEKQHILDKIIETDEKLAKIDFNYVNKGGISQKEWKSMQNQILKEEASRDVTRKWLRDIANSVIPFVILREELLQLNEQIKAEDEIQLSLSVENGLSNPEIYQELTRTFSSLGIEFSEDLSEKTINVIKAYFARKTGIQPLLYLSKQQQMDMVSKINNLIAFDTNRVQTATEEIAKSLQRVKKIRNKLERSEIVNHEAYMETKSKLLDFKVGLIQQSLVIEQHIEHLHQQSSNTELLLKKSKEKYEEYLRKKSVNDISAKALLAFDDLQKRLYKKYIKQVEVEFSNSFCALINKFDLIDGIYIDEELQVHPYKKRNYNVKDLFRMIQQFGENYVLEQLGSIAFEELQNGLANKNKEITLSVEVKQQLSAGEQQIFIMALYQALSKLNKVKVPYIIDTPFARIDASHRHNILSNFFMELKGQVLILSTDEEIVDEYKDHIESSLSDLYLLNHIEGESTEILKGVYFGGKQ